MKITLFTVEEANRALREIRPLVERIVALQGEIAALDRRIGVMSLALAGASASNPDAAECRALIGRRAELAHQIRDRLADLHGHGCVLKDVELGLVDFYALAGDRLVFLCWRLGEDEIAHWHTLDGGFSSRRPLDRTEKD